MNLIKLLFFILIIYAYIRSNTGPKFISPIPNEEQVLLISKQREREDERVTRLYKFFESRKSPLMGSSKEFIELADKYSVDWTLLPAIAGVESNFERSGNTTDHNPFGYMCDGKPCSFRSYSEAIEKVLKTISGSKAYQRYRESGEILELSRKYNYISPEEWTRKIIYFQQKIKNE